MKIYGYDIMDYEKGIIVAKSLEEATELFHETYPEVKVVEMRIDENEAEIWEITDEIKVGLYCNVPW